GLFSIQHHGIHRVAFLFSIIVATLLLCIGVKFIKTTGVKGWLSLRGVVLSITCVETMFANLVYLYLILAYMSEVAFLSKHHGDIQRSFYKGIPCKNFNCVLASVHSGHFRSHFKKSSSNFHYLFHHKPIPCIKLFSLSEDYSYSCSPTSSWHRSSLNLQLSLNNSLDIVLFAIAMKSTILVTFLCLVLLALANDSYDEQIWGQDFNKGTLVEACATGNYD
ncbi:Potassium transporter 1, partial [Mucuna pruriens]